MNYPYFMLLLIFFKISTEEPVVEIKASENHNAQAPKKVTLLLGVIGDEQKELDFFLKKLTQNISYSGQLDLIQKKFLAPKTKEEVTDLFKAGYPLVLFLQFFAKENMLEWRLYDSIEAEMVKGKKYSRTGLLQPRWAHGISADIWPELCQEPGIFLSKTLGNEQNLAGLAAKLGESVNDIKNDLPPTLLGYLPDSMLSLNGSVNDLIKVLNSDSVDSKGMLRINNLQGFTTSSLISSPVFRFFEAGEICSNQSMHVYSAPKCDELLN